MTTKEQYGTSELERDFGRLTGGLDPFWWVPYQ